MTTLTHPTTPAPARESYVPARSGLSFTGLIRSEWIKLWSVRSTAWSFAILVLVALGMAALTASGNRALFENSGGAGTLGGLPAADQAGILLESATIGVLFGQLIVAVLGVLVISGEYSTGMIKSTLTAAPRRLGALAAKAVVLLVCTFLVGLVSVMASLLVAVPMLSPLGLSISLFDPLITLPLLGAALYLALVSVFALGIGAILRSGAGGIAAALGIILLLPTVLALIGGQWAADASPYLISNAGTALFSPTGMEPWQGLLVVLGWIAVALGLAATLLKRRDA